MVQYTIQGDWICLSVVWYCNLNLPMACAGGSHEIVLVGSMSPITKQKVLDNIEFKNLY